MKMFSVLCDRMVGHTIEGVTRGIVAGDAFLAERHQELSVGAEFERLHVPAIGDPDISPKGLDTQKCVVLNMP